MGRPGQVAPGPAGFEGIPDDAGMPPVTAPPDASFALADAAPVSPTSTPPPDPAPAPVPVDAAASVAPQPPPVPVDAAPVAEPPAAPPPASSPPAPRLLRIHDLKVGRLTARVVHAHVLEAAAGSAGVVLPPDPDPLLKIELGPQDLEVPELTVDVLFAHDIKAGWVHIEETHAKMKGKGGGD